MKPIRRLRWLRAPSLVAAVTLFLAGSNYCVWSALSGNADMACLTAPVTEKPAQGCDRCHGGDADAGEDSAAAPSCCPDPVVAPAAPAVEKSAGAPAVSPIALAAESVLEISALHRGRPAASESPPPLRLARAPLPARAPPLA